jgi:type II secretory pathway pseudopilin PulG
MRGIVVGVAAIGIVSVLASAAAAQTPTRKRQQVVERSAAGTVIQPTRTIIHHADGTTTIITVPRRSYLDPGTDVPVGYPGTKDYAFPPGGDPGRPYWYFGPDTAGIGGTPLAQPWLIPGFTPGYPNPY